MKEQLRVNTPLDDDTLASLRFLRKELGGSSIVETVGYKDYLYQGLNEKHGLD